MSEHPLVFLSLKEGCTGSSEKCHIVGNHVSRLNYHMSVHLMSLPSRHMTSKHRIDVNATSCKTTSIQDQCEHVALTLIRCCLKVVCLLGRQLPLQTVDAEWNENDLHVESLSHKNPHVISLCAGPRTCQRYSSDV